MKFIVRADTPEMREARIMEMVTCGLPRHLAELAEQKREDICEQMFTIMEEELTKFHESDKERVGLAQTTLYNVCRTIMGSLEGCMDELERRAAAQAGIHILKLDIGDVHELLSMIFGEDPGRAH